MNCLQNLVKTQFLRNIANEIKLAHNTIITDSMQHGKPSFLPARLQDRKKLYDFYVKLYDFRAAFDDVDVSDPDELVYYLQQDNIVWVASRYKDVVDKAVLDTAYTTGEVCIHRAKHFIQNKAIYTAMFDLRLRITPLTKN